MNELLAALAILAVWTLLNFVLPRFGVPTG
jgi:hypothetical protein